MCCGCRFVPFLHFAIGPTSARPSVQPGRRKKARGIVYPAEEQHSTPPCSISQCTIFGWSYPSRSRATFSRPCLDGRSWIKSTNTSIGVLIALVLLFIPASPSRSHDNNNNKNNAGVFGLPRLRELFCRILISGFHPFSRFTIGPSVSTSSDRRNREPVIWKSDFRFVVRQAEQSEFRFLFPARDSGPSDRRAFDRFSTCSSPPR